MYWFKIKRVVKFPKLFFTSKKPFPPLYANKYLLNLCLTFPLLHQKQGVTQPTSYQLSFKPIHSTKSNILAINYELMSANFDHMLAAVFFVQKKLFLAFFWFMSYLVLTQLAEKLLHP